MSRDFFLPVSLPPQCAPRTALLNRFHRASIRRVTLVAAPAGSGKTVSTLLWLKDSGRRPIWRQMTDRFNSAAAFYRYVGEALLATQHDPAPATAILDTTEFDHAPITNFRRLVAALAPDDEAYGLVIDDLHQVPREEVWKGLPAALADLPANIAVFLLSRTDPFTTDGGADADAPEAAPARMARIGGAELAFTPEEIGAYFRACGRPLTSEEVGAIHARIGGWAIAVSLYAAGGGIPLGGAPSVPDYLDRQIWERWEPPLQALLLSTCVVEDVPEELARRLAGRDDAGAVLEHFRESHGLAVRQEDGAYRYHHLFLDYLRAKRIELALDDEPALLRAAAAYYREQGRPYDALRASLKGGDAAGVEAGMVELYQYNTRGNSVADHARNLRTYLIDITPDATLEDLPILLVNYVWYHYLMGDAERTAYYLDRLYARFPALAAEESPLQELIICLSTLDFRYDSTEKFLELAALARLPAPDTASAPARAQTITVTENQPFIHRGNHDYSALARDLDAGMAGARAAFGLVLGPDTDTIISGLHASLLYEQDRLEEAKAWIDRSEAALAADAVPEQRFATGLMGAMVTRAAGREKDYARRMAALADRLRAEALYLWPNFHAMRTRFLLDDADQDAARAWLAEPYVDAGEGPERPELYRLYQHFATARAHMALGHGDRALAWLVKLEQVGRECRRPLDEHEARVLRAAVEWAIGKPKAATRTLTRTLAALRPYGFVRLVANEGAAVLPILKRIRTEADSEGGDFADAEDQAARDHLERVYRAAKRVALRHRGLGWHLGGKPVKLAPRQRRLLELAATGLRQQEIAEAMGVALPTVKAHLAAIFRKFNVSRTEEAIHKARAIGQLAPSTDDERPESDGESGAGQ